MEMFTIWHTYFFLVAWQKSPVIRVCDSEEVWTGIYLFSYLFIYLSISSGRNVFIANKLKVVKKL